MSKLGPLILTKHSGQKHTATLIFFHGSGGNGPDMKEWVSIMHKNFNFPHIKVMFPTAPLQPYTPAGGLPSNVWFDREDISIQAPEKLDSISKIEAEVRNLISKENEAGIPLNRIIVGGFSMGGALSFQTGYRWYHNLAGVFAFSSFINNNSIIFDELKNNTESLPPLLQIHGDVDDLVPLKWGQDTFEQLKRLGVKGEFHVMVRLGHSLNQKGVKLIKNWVDKLLPES